MGKAKKKKKHGAAARAAPFPAAEGKVGAPAPSGDTILLGLQSLDASKRETACAAVAGIFASIEYGRGDSSRDANWAAVAQLVANGVIKKLLHRLVDAHPSVRLHAAGALANIAAIGDPKLCERLVHDDALTPAVRYLSEAPVDDPSPQLSQLLLQMATVLTGMLEASDAAAVRFTQAGGLQGLLHAAGTTAARQNPELLSMLLQALHVATDVNPVLATQISSGPGVVDALTAVAGGRWPGANSDAGAPQVVLTARLQAAGALVNAAQSLGPAGASDEAQTRLASVLLPLLKESLNYDPASLDAACASLLAMPPQSGGSSSGHATEEESTSNMETEDARSGDKNEAAANDVPGLREGAAAAVVAAAAAAGGKPKPKTGIETDGSDRFAAIRWKWKREHAEPLKLAAEILTNACSLVAAASEGDADGGEDDEGDWGSGDEAETAMEKAAAATAGRRATGDASAAVAGVAGTASPLMRALVQLEALPRVLLALQALMPQLDQEAAAASDAPLSPSEKGEGMSAGEQESPTNGVAAALAADVADLRSTVALCAANLVQNLPAEAIPNPVAVWNGLCALCYSASLAPAAQPAAGSSPLRASARAAVEPLTTTLWGLARRFGRTLAVPALQPAWGGSNSGSGCIPLLLRLLHPLETPSADARANAAGILGALASSAAKNALSSATFVRVAKALRGACNDLSVLVQGEALDAIMDAFASEDQQQAFDEAELLDFVAALAPKFKKKVAADGPALGRDVHAHLRETALNVTRFVKYKRNLAATAAAQRR